MSSSDYDPEGGWWYKGGKKGAEYFTFGDRSSTAGKQGYGFTDEPSYSYIDTHWGARWGEPAAWDDDWDEWSLDIARKLAAEMSEQFEQAQVIASLIASLPETERDIYSEMVRGGRDANE